MSSGVKNTERLFYKSALLDLVYYSNGQVWVENLQAYSKRLGHGTQCLKLACYRADIYHLTLHLEACRFGDDSGASNEQLVEMYKKRGFKMDPSYLDFKHARMIRYPRGVHDEPWCLD